MPLSNTFLSRLRELSDEAQPRPPTTSPTANVPKSGQRPPGNPSFSNPAFNAQVPTNTSGGSVSGGMPQPVPLPPRYLESSTYPGFPPKVPRQNMPVPVGPKPPVQGVGPPGVPVQPAGWGGMTAAKSAGLPTDPGAGMGGPSLFGGGGGGQSYSSSLGGSNFGTPPVGSWAPPGGSGFNPGNPAPPSTYPFGFGWGGGGPTVQLNPPGGGGGGGGEPTVQVGPWNYDHNGAYIGPGAGAIGYGHQVLPQFYPTGGGGGSAPFSGPLSYGPGKDFLYINPDTGNPVYSAPAVPFSQQQQVKWGGGNSFATSGVYKELGGPMTSAVNKNYAPDERYYLNPQTGAMNMPASMTAAMQASSNSGYAPNYSSAQSNVQKYFKS